MTIPDISRDHVEHLGGGAWEVAASVVDPELPMVTLEQLGILREVTVSDDGAVEVWLAPTYSGCPALATMRADVTRRLHEAGYAQVQVRTVLFPPWTTDWITPSGRAALAEAGIAPPGRVECAAPREMHQPAHSTAGLRCPRCGDAGEETSHFGPTPCMALCRCLGCAEPYLRVKEH